jgi:lipoprotein Spr
MKTITTASKSFVSSLTASQKNAKLEGVSVANAGKNNTIEFLENIAVKPGSISLNKSIKSTDNKKAVKYASTNVESMPANLSDVEKANWLQLKYSIKMDVAVEEIRNIPLLQKIDEWWGRSEGVV